MKFSLEEAIFLLEKGGELTDPLNVVVEIHKRIKSALKSHLNVQNQIEMVTLIDMAVEKRVIDPNAQEILHKFRLARNRLIHEDEEHIPHPDLVLKTNRILKQLVGEDIDQLMRKNPHLAMELIEQMQDRQHRKYLIKKEKRLYAKLRDLRKQKSREQDKYDAYLNQFDFSKMLDIEDKIRELEDKIEPLEDELIGVEEEMKSSPSV